jgi:hypothetical protein
VSNIENRIVRLGIELNGKINFYEDLLIYASGTLYASALAGESDVRITNLNKQNRDWIMTAVSPYNLNRTPKKLIVEAGRASTGVYRLFEGEIIRAELSQPPDLTISFKARSTVFNSGKIVAVNLGESTNLSDISKSVAADLDKSLNFQASDKLISNYSFNGAALKQIDKLGESGGVNAYIDGDKLIVKDYGQPLPGATLFLSEQTGMIGMPQLDVQGVTVKFLIDAKPTLGGGIEIESKLYPAVNGLYTIYKLDYEVSNREEPFYWIARGSRPGLGGI